MPINHHNWKRIPCRRCGGTGKYGRFGECFTCNGSSQVLVENPKEQVRVSEQVERIVKAFEIARSNGIQAPKLRLGAFKFSRAPDTGKNPGAIYVNAMSNSYKSSIESDAYMGKIFGGRFTPANACTPEIVQLILAAIADPESSAIAYGRKTGICSVCGRVLTNYDSIARGIGPICAGKFGWFVAETIPPVKHEPPAIQIDDESLDDLAMIGEEQESE